MVRSAAYCWILCQEELSRGMANDQMRRMRLAVCSFGGRQVLFGIIHVGAEGVVSAVLVYYYVNICLIPIDTGGKALIYNLKLEILTGLSNNCRPTSTCLAYSSLSRPFSQ